MNKFEAELKEFLRKKEKEKASIFVIRTKVRDNIDEVAEVVVYTTSSDDVTKSEYVVAKRLVEVDGEQVSQFTYKKIV